MIKKMLAGAAAISLLLAGGICAKADSAKAVLDRDKLKAEFATAGVTKIATAKSAGENETVSLGEGVVGFVSGDTFFIAPEIAGDIVYAPQNMSSLFENNTSLTEVSLTAMDFSDVESVWSMFGKSSVTSVELSYITFGENLSSLSSLFANSQSLESVTFRNVDLGGVWGFENMFSGCSALKEINFVNTDCSQITDISGMFSGCNQESFDLSFMDTSNVIVASSLFKDCKNLKNISLSDTEWKSLKNMSDMFSGCSSLESIDLQPFANCPINTLKSAFQNCAKIKTVNLNVLTSDKLDSLESTFSGCTSLENVEMDRIDGSKIGGIYGTFRNCTALSTADISALSSLNSIQYSFSGCSALTSVKFSPEVFTVSSYSGTFSDCSELKYVDFGGMRLNTKFDYTDTFSNCVSLTEICTIPDTYAELLRLKSSTCFPDGVSCHVDEDGNECCDRCGYLMKSSDLFQGVSLSLGDTVQFNMYADLDVCPVLLESGSYVELTLPDSSKQKLYVKDAGTDSTIIEGKTLYRFSFRLPLCFCEENQVLYFRGVTGDESRFGENRSYTLKNYYSTITGDKTGRYSYECTQLVESLETLGKYAYDYFCNEYKTGKLDTNMTFFNFQLGRLPKHSCTDEHYAGFTLLADRDLIFRIYWDEDFEGSVGKRDGLYFTQYRVAPYQFDVTDPVSGLCVNDYIIQVFEQYYPLNSSERTPEQSSLLNLCMALYNYGESAKNYYNK